MPRFEKGSKEAKEWAAKMRKAREAKKVSGGMIGDTPFGMPMGGKKLSLKSQSPPKMKSPEEVEYPDVEADFMPIKSADSIPLKDKKPKARKGAASITRPGDMDYTTKKGDKVFHENSAFVKKGRKPFMKGGYLQPGEVPLASTNEALIASKEVEAPVEMSAEQFITDEQMEGMGICGCRRCGMCGGALMSNPDNQYVPMLQAQLQQARFNSGEVVGGKVNLRKGLTKVGKAFGKVGEALNPISYALKDKSTRDAMIASGDVTQNYALPAVTTAGLPLYYGAAGTAGMLVGGPLGSLAATKAADELYKGMVVKPGYDPQQRQKSKTLGVVSKEVGKLGAARFKQGMSAPTSSAPKSGGVAQAGKGLRKKKKLIIIE